MATNNPGLLTLPAELRNNIYSILVPNTKSIDLDLARPALHQAPPLATVCRQLRKEVLPIYLGSNTFRHQFGSGRDHILEHEVTLVIDWLKSLGRFAKCLRRVDFLFERPRALDLGEGLLEPALLRSLGVESRKEQGIVRFGLVRGVEEGREYVWF